ncbi:hypothetical protein ICN35_08750 [Polynucleobacter sp. es-GGE-1]|uniref:hypothetical protein n=1 Tax=Polynucleobacter sp. es-GGE-1 TaxID=1819724 RepID=UPI001C0B7424|nr:hypothetical protein [Polynucleobacter sp. es-GGE-1]MBU3635547.1 hypothetical protein [Polynucleobacter sp. es-GGE-1]
MMIRFNPSEFSNCSISQNYNYDRNGIFLYKNFLTPAQLLNLNFELDELFSRPVLNHNHKASIWLNNHYKSISSPTSIESTNILELAVDVFHLLIPTHEIKKTIITHLNIYSEISNSEVPWHVDRTGHQKVSIVLKGGSKDSGLFSYVPNSHSINHSIGIKNLSECNDGDHILTGSEVSNLKPYAKEIYASPGDLISFNSLGMHHRGKCLQERRIIFIEFQSIDSPHGKQSIDINNLKLSKKVLDNLHIFFPGKEDTYFNYGLDCYKSLVNYLPSSVMKFATYVFFKSLISRVLKKFLFILKK